MRRPLVLAALCFLAGAATAHWRLDAGLAVVAIGIAGTLGCVLLPNTRRNQSMLFAALFLAVGSGTALLRMPYLQGPQPQHPEYWTLPATQGEVVDAPVITEAMDYAPVIVQTAAGERALLRWSDPSSVYPGQRVQFQGAATTLISTCNFGLSTAEDYYRAHGVRYAVTLQGSALRVLDTPEYNLWYWIGRLRAWKLHLIEKHCPQDIVPFIAAVWLGQRIDMTQEELDTYTRTGTVHMLSVSGLHVAIIYFSLEFLLTGLTRRPKLRAAIIIAVILVFAVMAGARVATLRAAFMIAFYLSARFVNREPDAPTSMALCGILFITWNPFWLADAGALLSFGSVASLLLYADPIASWLTRRLRMPMRVASPIAACIAVQVLTLPLTAEYFMLVPLTAPLANLMAIPVLDVVLWLCLAMTLCGIMVPPFALLMGHAMWLPVRFIEESIAWLSQWDPLVWTIPPPSTPALLLYMAAVLLPAAAAGPNLQVLDPPPGAPPPIPFYRRRSTMAAVALLVFSAVLWRPPTPRGQVDFLDVGHGDATVVWPPEGGVVLIDGGDRSEFKDLGRQVVAPFLIAHGAARVDAMVVSHPDRDHIGGLFTVIEQLPVGQVFMSEWISDRDVELEFAQLCERKNIPITRLAMGEHFAIGGATFDALHPPLGFVPPAVNDASLVLRVSWEREGGVPFTMLMPGDVELPAELLLQQRNTVAQVLHVPHHGSSTSSSAGLLDAVAPSMAIASTRTTSRRNAMGPSVEARYAERGISLWRTDLHGGLRLNSETFSIQGAREGRWR